MQKQKLLIVGSFPFMRSDYKEDIFFGGIVSSSNIIINSKAFDNYELILIDSSQNSNPMPTLFKRTIKAIKRLLLLLKKLIVGKPDASLIFASDGASAIEKGMMVVLCKLFGSKALIFPRAGRLIQQTDRNILFKIIIKFMFKRSSIFLCQGPKWQEYAIKNLSIPAAKVLTINNWTATDELLEIGSQRKYDSNEKTKILFVGWLEDFKGVFELLSVIMNHLKDDPNLVMTFVGDGSATEEAKRIVKNNGLNDNIKFLGWRSGKELNECYKNNNIFVLPSWSEGLPNAVIEAMAAGLSVITTNVGTIPEVFTNKENLILVSPKNEEQLLESIKTLTLDSNLRIKLAKNGHIFSKDNFSSEQVLLELSDSIKEIISKK